MVGYSWNGPRGPPNCASAPAAISRMAPAAVRARVRTGVPLALRRRALLGQRTVVFLDRLTESFRHLVRARERERVVSVVGLAAQRELELLQLFDRCRLQLLQPFGIGVDAIVVERAQVAQHFLEFARADA